MRLIQAKVSEELFRWFSHYLVDHDLTVSEAISEWIENTCEKGSGERKRASERKEVVEVGRVVKVEPATVSAPAKPTPEEVEAKQRSCKHAFLPGSRQCVKCGWVPPIMG